jgi:hypothetical protein
VRGEGAGNLAGGWWLCFKGEWRGGGPRGVGAAWNWSGRERGREGGGVRRGNSGSRQQPPVGGRGVAVLWRTEEGCGGAGDMSDATDRLGRVMRGARWQRLGAGAE